MKRKYYCVTLIEPNSQGFRIWTEVMNYSPFKFLLNSFKQEKIHQILNVFEISKKEYDEIVEFESN